MEKEIEEYIQQIFAQYPQEDGFWFTRDGLAFTEKNKQDAINHGKTLEDKRVVWFDRSADKSLATDEGKEQGDAVESDEVEIGFKAKGNKSGDVINEPVVQVDTNAGVPDKAV
jgi:hypothetical protein